MIFGYVHKCTEEQRQEIGELAACNGIAIDQWIENINYANAGDIIIADNISQFGNGLLPILDKLMPLLKAGIQLWTVEEGYKLGGDSGATLAYAFELCSSLKRRIISERSRESLRYAKFDGKKLGRPLGKHNAKTKLTGRATEIHRLLSSGLSRVEVARMLGVSRGTLAAFLTKISIFIPV